jgi:hypothetical protein
VLGLVGKSAENYAKALEEIQVANAETAKSAEALIAATSGGKLKQQAAELEGILVDSVGRPVIKTLTSITESLGGVKVAVGGVALGFTALALGGVIPLLNKLDSVITGFVEAKVAANNLGKAMKVLQFAKVAAGIGVAYIAALEAAGAFREWRASLKAADSEISAFTANSQVSFEAELAALRKANEDRTKNLDDLVANSDRAFSALQQQYNQDLKDATRFQELTNASLQRQLNKRVSLAQSLVSELQRIQQDASENIKDINNTVLGLKFEQGQGAFDRSIKDLPETQQASALVKRSEQILNAAREAFRKGNKELGTELLQTGQQLVNKAADIDISKQADVNRFYTARIDILNRLKAAEGQRARLAEQEEERVAALADDLATQVSIVQSTPLLEPGEDASSEKALQNLELRREALARIASIIPKLKGLNLEKILDSTRASLTVKQLEAGIVSPLTGGLDSLENIATQQYHAILTKLAQATDDVPIEIKLAFKDQTGRDFDPVAGPAQFAQNMAKAAAQIRKELSALEDLPGLERDIRNSAQGIQARQQATRGVLEANGVSPEITRLSEAVLSQISTALQQAQTGTPEGLKAAQATLAELIKKQTVFQAGADARPRDDLSSAAVAERAVANLLTTSVAGLQTILESQAKALPLREVSNSMDDATQKVRAFSGALEKATRLPGALGAAIERGAANLQNRAAGGAIGPDTVGARLTPGEFVMNPRSSQAFRPLLRTLNNMALPRFAQGGSVTNVGDVNINISGRGADKINARDLASRFQREIRKGTIR